MGSNQSTRRILIMWKDELPQRFKNLAAEIGFTNTFCWVHNKKKGILHIIMRDGDEDKAFPFVFKDYLIDKQIDVDTSDISDFDKSQRSIFQFKIPVPVYEPIFSKDQKVVDFLQDNKDFKLTRNRAIKQNSTKYQFGERVIPFNPSPNWNTESFVMWWFISSWSCPGSGVYALVKENRGILSIVSPSNIRKFNEVVWVENE